MRKKVGKMKCLGCNWQFSIDLDGGELQAKCPKCGLLHSGDAQAWGELNLSGLQLVCPKKLNGQFEIRVHPKAGKEA